MKIVKRFLGLFKRRLSNEEMADNIKKMNLPEFLKAQKKHMEDIPNWVMFLEKELL